MGFVAVYALNLGLFTVTGGFGRMGGPGWEQDELAQNQMLLIFLGLPAALPALLFLAATGVTAWTGRSGPWVVTLGLLVLIGGVSLVTGVAQVIDQTRSTAFPSVRGTILSSRMDVQENTSDTRADRLKFNREIRFFFLVDYEYEVQGRPYRGSRYELETYDYDREEVLALVDRYRPETPLRVYYDPAQPSRAVLKPGLTRVWFLPFVLAATVLLAAAGLSSLPPVRAALKKTDQRK